MHSFSNSHSFLLRGLLQLELTAKYLFSSGCCSRVPNTITGITPLDWTVPSSGHDESSQTTGVTGTRAIRSLLWGVILQILNGNVLLTPGEH